MAVLFFSVGATNLASGLWLGKCPTSNDRVGRTYLSDAFDFAPEGKSARPFPVGRMQELFRRTNSEYDTISSSWLAVPIFEATK